MLHNIFLFKGTESNDPKDLNFYSYPNEVINLTNKDFLNQIIKQNNLDFTEIIKKETSNHIKIEQPITQIINNLNVFTFCINKELIIGLIFDIDDNPFDYKEIFVELLTELLNNGSKLALEDEFEIDNILISIFIDLRRYGDEVVDKSPEIEFYYQQDSFYKVFLFGIDEVGKSSLVRRLKTGKFDENYFTPTKKFNIEYIQEEEKGLLAFWDVPGQRVFRSKWLRGLQESNIFVYMIDVANQRRFEESKQELWNIIDNIELSEFPLVILGNKIDLVKRSDCNFNEQLQNLEKELSDFFNFEKIRSKNWKFIFTSVKTNYNIDILNKLILDLVTS